MANAGMGVNALQYLMGRSDAGVTLNIHTHATCDRAAEQMAELMDFRAVTELKKVKKSG